MACMNSTPPLVITRADIAPMNGQISGGRM
jgi:hypothetical protein